VGVILREWEKKAKEGREVNKEYVHAVGDW
jgi:hypothetical protein